MGFRHTKFEDSSTMRSLERVAQEKGWIKQEPVIKTASKKLDLSPSDNLVENILKLCGGLRQSDMEKYAVELEDKLFIYKQAQTLYEVNKEKGEDLVDAAHPKGSHKLENVDSDEAVVETIVDRHLKMVKTIDKMPTGKLASSADILNAVKIVLGENEDDEVNSESSEDQLSATISSCMNNYLDKLNKLNDLTQDELTVPIDIQNIVVNNEAYKISNLISNPTTDNIQVLIDYMSKLYTRLNPNGAVHYLSLGHIGLSQDTWIGVTDLIHSMNSDLKLAFRARTLLKRQQGKDVATNTNPNRKPISFERTDPTTGNIIDQTTTQLTQLYNDAIKQIVAWKTILEAKISNKLLDAADPKIIAIQNWLNNTGTALNTASKKFDLAGVNKPTVATYYLEAFNKNFKPFLDAAKNSEILK